MCAVVAPRTSRSSWPCAASGDVIATVIGEVTEGDRLRITWNGETVVDATARTVALGEGRSYQRPRPVRTGRTS